MAMLQAVADSIELSRSDGDPEQATATRRPLVRVSHRDAQSTDEVTRRRSGSEQ